MSSKASSTIGFERRFNRALALGGLDEFVAASLGEKTVRPPNVEHLVALNRGPFVGAQRSLERVESADGARVLDVRSAEEFAAGHVAGAVSIPLSSSSFGTKAGFLFGPEERIAVHAGSVEDADLAAGRLRAVGLLELAGYLAHPPTPERLDTVGVDELQGLVEAGAVEVVDVREADERDEGYIPGSRHVPYRLAGRFADELDDGRPVVTICETGSRAVIAASVLAAKGVDARPVLHGGVRDWRERGGQLVRFRRCGS